MIPMLHHDFYAVLAALVFCHFIADFPLQGDWLAKAKNHTLELIPGERIWLVSLFGHAYIHAMFVYLITGMYFVALAELTTHMWIDYGKSDGKFTYNQDQFLHLWCKVVWAAAFTGLQAFLFLLK